MTGAATPLLEARGATRVIDGEMPTTLIADIDLRVEPGEFIAVTGPSGSGKSSLLYLLGLLDLPTRGEILVEGRPTSTLGEDDRARLRLETLGFVFQFHFLLPEFSALENVMLPMRALGRRPEGAMREQALRILASLGLADQARKRPDQMSGGQRQRVAIARALAVEPEVLVADEPTSMLDVSVRVGILNLLAQLKREQGLGIVLITHDLASARYLADRILVCHRGRVVEDAAADTLLATPTHPYTRALLDSIAGLDAEAGPRTRAASAASPGGCPFASRCPDVFDLCRTSDPAPRPVGAALVRCHLHGTAPGPAPASAKTAGQPS